jgi:hypothetical protein
MALWLKKIQKRNPQDLRDSKWYLTQEKSGTVWIKDIAKEIEGRSALSLGAADQRPHSVNKVLAV